MNAVGFAWRSLVRQPARATLGILGVAAVGALLFDMLLLSEGLIVSTRELLGRRGYDVRVTATTDLPRSGPRLQQAEAIRRDIATLPGVKGTLAIRFADAHFDVGRDDARHTRTATVEGTSGNTDRPWSLVRGHEPSAGRDVVISEAAASALAADVGSTLALRVSCSSREEALPPLPVRVTGVAEFTFELGDELTVASSMPTLEAACGGESRDEADMILVVSTGNPEEVAAAIRAAHPELRAASNEEMLGRIQSGGFTYFQQISTVLTTVTVAFSALLITVLLTVSVNQRLGEIAALRALGFSRRRMVADVLSESALIVGIGGILSLPLGWGLARLLDDILRSMPGIPAQLHFFVFQTTALMFHLALLTATALLAALYPMRIVSRLPIAATLRAEVIG